MSRHLPEFDLIRTTAALAVITIHTTAGYMELGLGYFCNHAVRFAVPLFIIISGFLLYWGEQGHRILPTWQFCRKRLHKIMVPYIIWTLIYHSLNAYILRLSDPGLYFLTLANSLFLGNAYYHLYFLIIILQLYLIYPVLRKYMSSHPHLLLGAALALTGTIQILLFLNLVHIITLPSQYALLYLRAFPTWLFYFVLGMFAARQIKEEDPEGHALSSFKLAALGVMWLGGFALMIFDSRLTGIYVSIVRPSVMLYAVASYYFFHALASRYKQWGLRSGIKWMAAQSFLIYLMHPLVMTFLQIIARRTYCPALWSGTLGMICFFAAITTGTILAAVLISRTPLAGILGGVRQ